MIILNRSIKIDIIEIEIHHIKHLFAFLRLTECKRHALR